MKTKLDENMPRALADFLLAGGHDVSTVPEENLCGADDPPIIGRATSEGRILLTFDTDFCNVRNYPPGTHSGIVVFRLHGQRWESLRRPAREILESDVLERVNRGIAIVDEARVRIRTTGAPARRPHRWR